MPESHGLTSELGRWAMTPAKVPVQDHWTSMGANRRCHRNPKGELSAPDPSDSPAINALGGGRHGGS
jgi:hypothetical protein